MSDQMRPTLAEIGREYADLVKSMAQIGQCACPEPARIRECWAENWPASATICVANISNHLANIGQSWPNRTNLGQLGATPAKNVGRHRLEWTDFGSNPGP